MSKGDQSRQRLIACAAELFWKNGYAATGVSEILSHAGLPKGSFYFYFKSKDALALAAISYYQEKLLDKLNAFSVNQSWEAFLNDVFAYLEGQPADSVFCGCPFAVMGMELALQKSDIAKCYLDGIKQLQALFCRVLLQSGFPPIQADTLSERMLAVFQGSLLLVRISQDYTYLVRAKENMVQICKEYRAFYDVPASLQPSRPLGQS